MIRRVNLFHEFLLLGTATVLLLSAVSSAAAQELTVAAAADARPALEEIATRFKASTGKRLNLIYGSSGKFYQQIQNGAPFDLFFSADIEYPKKLEAAGLTVPGSYYEYARGKLVLLVAAKSTLDLQPGLKVLLDPQVNKIAIADPAHAPYGRAAVAALKTEGIYDKISAKIVTGENISQAASFVFSGAADAGIAALSLAVSPSSREQARFVEIPANDYPPIQQACVVLRSSKQQQLASEFGAYIRGSEAAAIFKRYGFEVPGR
jgi:molybdate transport system substrate-binding protein